MSHVNCPKCGDCYQVDLPDGKVRCRACDHKFLPERAREQQRRTLTKAQHAELEEWWTLNQKHRRMEASFQDWLATATPREVLDAWLRWNGIIGFTTQIWELAERLQEEKS